MNDIGISILRKLITFCLWTFGLFLMVALTTAITFGNYESLRISWRYTGSDQVFLGEGILWGWIFETLGVGNSTQSDFYAMPLAISLALMMFLFVHFLFRAMRLYFEKKSAEHQGVDVHEYNNQIKKNLTIAFFIAIPLVLVSILDFKLFQLRWLIGSAGLDGGRGAAPEVASFVNQIAHSAAYGYLGLLLGLAVSIECMAEKASESLEILIVLIRDYFRSLFHNPVPATSFPKNPNPINSGNLNTTIQQKNIEESLAVPESRLNKLPDSEPNFESSDERDELVEVISSQPGQKVSMEEALNNENFVVDLSTKTVWEKEFFDSLHKEDEQN